MIYLFHTSLSMKPYNCKKWFIDGDMVKDMFIEADSVSDALKQYAEYMDDDYCITITKHGINHKQPMYRDYKDGTTKQVGWVITGKTMFRDDDRYGWSDQYIDCWIDIMAVTEFEDIA